MTGNPDAGHLLPRGPEISEEIMYKKVFKQSTAGIMVMMLLLSLFSAWMRNSTVKAAQSLTIGDYEGTLRDEATVLTKEWIYGESGAYNGGEIEAEDSVTLVSNGSGNVRTRAKINEGKGAPVVKGDYLVIRFDHSENIDVSGYQIQGLIDDPAGWDSIDLGYLAEPDENGWIMIPLTSEYYNQTLYAIRLKASPTPAEGEWIRFSYIGILTNVKNIAQGIDNISYTPADSVCGITVTYYDDVFSRGFAWRTFGTDPADSMLQYVLKSDVADLSTFDWDAAYEAGVVKSEADYCDTVFTNTNGKDTYYCHKAHLTDLAEDTSCYYRVGSPSGGWSKVGEFTVNTDETKVTIIHVTDPQATTESEYAQYAKALQMAEKTAKSDYFDGYTAGVINTGDITNSNHDGTIHIEEYNMAQDMTDLRNSVIIPVAGNHDVTDNVWSSMYDIDYVNYCTDGSHNNTRTGGCYSVRYANVYIINTNSNESGDLSGNGSGEYDPKADYHEQYAWIESELQKAASLRDEGAIDWIIITTHAGMMSVGYHTLDGGSVQLRKNLVPLFAKYDVDLVLQGHDHAYTRTVPYYYGNDINGGQFDGYTPNNRETFEGYGTVSQDDPYTEQIETESGRIWNVEPEGTHYVTINYSGVKSLDVSVDYYPGDESKIPPQYIYDGLAVSPVNGKELGLTYAKQFFALINIEGDTLTYDTYEIDGARVNLFDTFTCIKDGAHKPNLEKQDIRIKGVSIESKQYDGRAPKMNVARIYATDAETGANVPEFNEYGTLMYSVTGTLADGTEYTENNKIPVNEGTYVLHVTVSSQSAFFRGDTEVPFTISKAGSQGGETGSGGDSGAYVGGLTGSDLPYVPVPSTGGESTPSYPSYPSYPSETTGQSQPLETGEEISIEEQKTPAGNGDTAKEETAEPVLKLTKTNVGKLLKKAETKKIIVLKKGAKKNIKVTLPSQLVKKTANAVIGSNQIGVTFKYSSSDKDVVTVSKNGKLTAKGRGAAVITIKMTADNGKTRTVKVNVTVR